MEFIVLALLSQDFIPQDLFARCAAVPADNRAWTEFFRRYQKEIELGICRVIGFPPSRQYNTMFDDIVQQAHTRLLVNGRRALLAFRGTSEAEAKYYLRQIAVRVSLSAVTRKPGRNTIPLDEGPDNDNWTDHLGMHVPPDEKKILLKHEINQYLQERLGGGKKSRNTIIFKLSVYEGLSSEDIASITNLKVTSRAVEIQTSRIRLWLQKHLENI